ncbi:MAG: ABC transporter permease [Ilumatobacteraceae bacterium]
MAVPVADGSARLGGAMRALAERSVVVDDVGLRRPTPRRGVPRPHGSRTRQRSRHRPRRRPRPPADRHRSLKEHTMTITTTNTNTIDARVPSATSASGASGDGDGATLATVGIDPPAGRTGVVGTAATFAGRTLRQFWRTPDLIVVGGLTSAMFLLIFRYVFGGAIGTGDVSYVDFLIPGLAAAARCSPAPARPWGWRLTRPRVCSIACDRFPCRARPCLLGRSAADTVLVAWGLLITVGLGFATGFRLHGSLLETIAAVGLCLVYGAAFTWPFIYMGLVAGSAQAAQGLSFLAFPFVFVSSAYVPVESMPGWMQPVAEHQPITPMVGSVRALALGDQAEAALGHTAAWFAVRAVVWSIVIVAIFLPLSTRRFAKA